MKKLLLSLIFVSVAATTFAQEEQPVAKRPSVKGFVSNKFWDNWEVSAGAGIGTSMNNKKDYGMLRRRLGFEVNASATKWLHPVFGTRLQVQGGNLVTYSTDEVRDKWPYIFAHVDFMINFSNWVGGYREDRAYYGVPFFGFGYMAGNITDESRVEGFSEFENYFAFSYGWLSKFRLAKAWDFNIELKGLMVPSQIHSGVGNVTKVEGNYTFGFSATAGFTYRFNKRDFQRCAQGYSADDIRAFQDAVAAGNAALAAANAALLAANADNDRLGKELNDAKNTKAAPAKVVVPSTVILYDINDATLSEKEMTRLQMLAHEIKKGPSSQKYSIWGYADQGTGNDTINKALGEQRAKAVYDYLLGQGVNADQLSCEGHGTDDDFTPIAKGNRAVIIKL